MVLAVVKGLTTQPDVNSNYDKEATFYTYSGGAFLAYHQVFLVKNLDCWATFGNP